MSARMTIEQEYQAEIQRIEQTDAAAIKEEIAKQKAKRPEKALANLINRYTKSLPRCLAEPTEGPISASFCYGLIKRTKSFCWDGNQLYRIVSPPEEVLVRIQDLKETPKTIFQFLEEARSGQYPASLIIPPGFALFNWKELETYTEKETAREWLIDADSSGTALDKLQRRNWGWPGRGPDYYGWFTLKMHQGFARLACKGQTEFISVQDIQKYGFNVE